MPFLLDTTTDHWEKDVQEYFTKKTRDGTQILIERLGETMKDNEGYIDEGFKVAMKLIGDPQDKDGLAISHILSKASKACVIHASRKVLEHIIADIMIRMKNGEDYNNMKKVIDKLKAADDCSA